MGVGEAFDERKKPGPREYLGPGRFRISRGRVSYSLRVLVPDVTPGRVG